MVQIALISAFALTAIVACIHYGLRNYPLPEGKSPLRFLLFSMAICGVLGLGGAVCGVYLMLPLYLPGLWLASVFDFVGASDVSCGAMGPNQPDRIIVWNTIAGVFAGACLGTLLTLLSKRRHRSLDPPRCPCGYDLTGNVSGVCPECGEPIQ